MNTDLGPLLYSFFEDYLKCQKGLRSSSLKSYRDSLRLFLLFLAEKTGHKVSRLTLADLTCAQVLAFLQSLETDRGNQVRTRNQRLAAIWQCPYFHPRFVCDGRGIIDRRCACCWRSGLWYSLHSLHPFGRKLFRWVCLVRFYAFRLLGGRGGFLRHIRWRSLGWVA